MTIYRLGNTSRERLETCDPRLQLVIRGALATGLIDMSVTEGVRSEQKQNEYYAAGKSRLKWPRGKHNVTSPDQKSTAVDVAPYVNGKLSYDQRHCCFMAGIIMGVAQSIGFKIRWGGNWDMDGEPVSDQDFQDLVHFELIS